VDILGGAQGLNYAYDYRSVGGIMIPATRKVVANEGDFKPVWAPVLVEIEIDARGESGIGSRDIKGGNNERQGAKPRY
jgi:hypothetical protein